MTNLEEKISSIKSTLDMKKGELEKLRNDLRKFNDKINELQNELDILKEARSIIQNVAAETQEKLEYKISQLSTLALRTIFSDPYTLRISFDQKRGKTEATIFLERNGKTYEITEVGGGVIDVTSFALRLSILATRARQTDKILILDEPFKFLSRDLQPFAVAMMRKLNERLKYQIIMVTHNEELIEAGDKKFRVQITKGGKSSVKEESRKTPT